MKTIGRHWPRNAPRGDYIATCQMCGVHWRRSQLTIGAGGLLVCPDDVGDTRVAAAPHIFNNDGTGTAVAPYGEQTDFDLPVIA